MRLKTRLDIHDSNASTGETFTGQSRRKVLGGGEMCTRVMFCKTSALFLGFGNHFLTLGQVSYADADLVALLVQQSPVRRISPSTHRLLGSRNRTYHCFNESLVGAELIAGLSRLTSTNKQGAPVRTRSRNHFLTSSPPAAPACHMN
jgi:hypothetical protein